MLYTIGVQTTSVTDAHAAWELQTAASPGRIRLMELGVFMAAATASCFGLGRHGGAVGSGAVSTNLVPQDPNDVVAASTLLSYLAWSVSEPTVPATYMRRCTLPAVVGAGVIWTFGKGIVISVSSSIVLWNIGIGAPNGAADCYAVFEI